MVESMFLGGEFLDLTKTLLVSREMARYHAMLGVEIGGFYRHSNHVRIVCESCVRGSFKRGTLIHGEESMI